MGNKRWEANETRRPVSIPPKAHDHSQAASGGMVVPGGYFAEKAGNCKPECIGDSVGVLSSLLPSCCFHLLLLTVCGRELLDAFA